MRAAGPAYLDIYDPGTPKNHRAPPSRAASRAKR